MKSTTSEHHQHLRKLSKCHQVFSHDDLPLAPLTPTMRYTATIATTKKVTRRKKKEKKQLSTLLEEIFGPEELSDVEELPDYHHPDPTPISASSGISRRKPHTLQLRADSMSSIPPSSPPKRTSFSATTAHSLQQGNVTRRQMYKSKTKHGDNKQSDRDNKHLYVPTPPELELDQPPPGPSLHSSACTTPTPGASLCSLTFTTSPLTPTPKAPTKTLCAKKTPPPLTLQPAHKGDGDDNTNDSTNDHAASVRRSARLVAKYTAAGMQPDYGLGKAHEVIVTHVNCGGTRPSQRDRPRKRKREGVSAGKMSSIGRNAKRKAGPTMSNTDIEIERFTQRENKRLRDFALLHRTADGEYEDPREKSAVDVLLFLARCDRLPSPTYGHRCQSDIGDWDRRFQ